MDPSWAVAQFQQTVAPGEVFGFLHQQFRAMEHFQRLEESEAEMAAATRSLLQVAVEEFH